LGAGSDWREREKKKTTGKAKGKPSPTKGEGRQKIRCALRRAKKRVIDELKGCSTMPFCLFKNPKPQFSYGH
jgi:hypothetical protein